LHRFGIRNIGRYIKVAYLGKPGWYTKRKEPASQQHQGGKLNKYIKAALRITHGWYTKHKEPASQKGNDNACWGVV
jgi:hypothetical protein